MKIQLLNWKRGGVWSGRWLAWLIVCGIGCSGCYQATVVPPPASISPPQRPSVSNPGPADTLSPPSSQPIDPITSNNPWKPDAELRKWDYIVLHHTASDTGSVETIHQEHLKRKDKNGNAWMGIGYHFVIGNGNGMGDGEIEPTFRWRQQLQGAHAGVADYNQHGIGVVLIGNFDRAAPSEAQTAAVKQLISVLKREYRIAANNVIGHGDVKATECPGKYFPLEKVREGLALNGDHAAQQLRHGLAAADGNRSQPSTECDADMTFVSTNLPGESQK